jgi:predicted transcriptional regulator
MLTQHNFRAKFLRTVNDRSREVANITFKIDDELLEKARQLAFQRKTSINAIVKQRLVEFVSSDLGREATLSGLEAFFERSTARVGKKTWTRDEIHER